MCFEKIFKCASNCIEGCQILKQVDRYVALIKSSILMGSAGKGWKRKENDNEESRIVSCFDAVTFSFSLFTDDMICA